MEPDWAAVATDAVGAAGPILGVLVGAVVARGTTRTDFRRERAVSEIDRRRQCYAAYIKALWSYHSRVMFLRGLVVRRNQVLTTTSEHVRIRVDITRSQACQQACRDAFADVQMFSSVPAQSAGRAAMEALTAAHTALQGTMSLQEADGHLTEFSKEHVAFARAVNDDVVQMNNAIYAVMTPLWRAVLGRASRQPLPYEVPEPPSDVHNPDPGHDEEGVG